MEKPLDGRSSFDVLRSYGSQGERFEEDQDETGSGVSDLSFDQGTGFSFEGLGINGIGADLDEAGIWSKIEAKAADQGKVLSSRRSADPVVLSLRELVKS